MPIPWTTAFLTYWTNFVALFGTAYNGNTHVDMIECGGCGWEGEASMGIWTSNGWTTNNSGWNGNYGTYGPFTAAKIETAWTTVLNAYVSAFPSKLLCFTADEPLSNNQGNTNGTSIAATLWGNAVTSGITRFQANALGATPSRPGHAQYTTAQAEFAAGNTIGWQEWLASANYLQDPGGATSAAQWFANACAIAENTNASHVEIYQADAILSANTTNITALAASGGAATHPSTPAAPTASGGNAQATVTWTAPFNGGDPITGYTITTTGTGAPGPVTVGNVLSTVITGLTNGDAYTFTVYATNAIGNSSASASSNSVTPMSPPTLPATPTGVVGTPGAMSAALTWTAPDNGGAAITSYTITPYVGMVAQSPIVTGSSATSATVTGLTNWTTYVFTVAATNSVGTGAASNPSAGITPPGLAMQASYFVLG